MDFSLATYEYVHSIGFWLLIAGLVGDVVVFLDRDSRVLGRKAGIAFALLIALGVGLEEYAAANIDDLKGDRVLSKEQQREVADACAGLKGSNVFISSYGGDGEAARLAHQIAAALTAAGISIDDNLGRTEAVRGGVELGISIAGPDATLVNTVAEALTAVGLKTDAYIREPTFRIGSSVHGILVGIKPPAE